SSRRRHTRFSRDWSSDVCSSDLPTWPYGNGHAWEPFEPTRWEQLVSMMPYQQLQFRPGSRYGYSNPAFIYLARVIESITGDPYQSWIQKNIWTPLGLTRSYFGSTPY